MAAKISAEMLRVRKLITEGVPVYAACEREGLTPGAVYRSAWYKARKASKECDATRQGDEMFCAKCSLR